ncbi:MAG TPA: hypothetical protein VFD04_08440 [Actinomycetes bacterium]|jgi:hypothetical protein|nr:hypothetical protein [Actinomycetes bacterium]
MTAGPNEPSTPIPEPPEHPAAPRDAAYWAKNVSTLKLGEVPAKAVNLNVTGKRVVGPVQGFGKMWQKTVRVELRGAEVSPTEVITTWKAEFQRFWPPRNWFYAPLTGIAPGEVALLNLTMPGRMKLSTGVLVLYADEESFTLMTPQGHVLAGWITFSATTVDGVTVVQVQALERTNDPLYELGFLLGGNRFNTRFWVRTVENLARHFGVEPQVEVQAVCVDRRRQWRKAGNLKHNAAIRTALWSLGAPLRWLARPFRHR